MKKKKISVFSFIKNKAFVGEYIYVEHAKHRLNERSITDPEVRYVLLNGFHEAKKDVFNEQFATWNYSIKGKTVDCRKLRIVVTFDVDDMLIITVIDLEN